MIALNLSVLAYIKLLIKHARLVPDRKHTKQTYNVESISYHRQLNISTLNLHFRFLSHQRAAKAQVSLRICTDPKSMPIQIIFVEQRVL